MKTTLRKLITVGLDAAMPLTLAACDDSSDNDPSDDGSDVTVTTIVTDLTTAPDETTVPG